MMLATSPLTRGARISARVGGNLPSPDTQQIVVHGLNLGARPWSPPQEFQARCDAWIAAEAPDIDPLTHGVPTIVRNQLVQDPLQRHAVHRVGVIRRFGHCSRGFVWEPCAPPSGFAWHSCNRLLARSMVSSLMRARSVHQSARSHGADVSRHAVACFAQVSEVSHKFSSKERPMNFGGWLGENRSNTQRYRDGFQRRQATTRTGTCDANL
jgi:hypothetical protein